MERFDTHIKNSPVTRGRQATPYPRHVLSTDLITESGFLHELEGSRRAFKACDVNAFWYGVCSNPMAGEFTT